MINSRTYLLRNQIHDLVKFFQANRDTFEITAVLGELRGTEDQKKLEVKIFDLLQKEIRGGVEVVEETVIPLDKNSEPPQKQNLDLTPLREALDRLRNAIMPGSDDNKERTEAESFQLRSEAAQAMADVDFLVTLLEEPSETSDDKLDTETPKVVKGKRSRAKGTPEGKE